MDSKKHLLDLELEELLALAEKSEKTSSLADYNAMNEAEKFIYYNNIQAGEDRVMAIVIYDAYVKWKGGREYAFAKHMFFREFSKLFQVKRAWKGRYYLLNGDNFDTSKENFQKIREKYIHKKKKETRRGKKESNVAPKEEIKEPETISCSGHKLQSPDT